MYEGGIMNIKFGHPNIDCNSELLKKIEDVLNSGWVSIGLNMRALEYHFEEKFNVAHAIACSSGTTGLIIAIKAAGWKNQKIMLPSFTWPSTLYALECNGNFPVFCDIEKDTWLSCANESPYNMIAVDIFGNEAPLYPTGKYNINGETRQTNVIYDAAHGYGLPNLGRRGLAEVVSLSFTKMITATEGGMILTDDDELAETATELRRLSGRMEEINALIAMESIKDYEENHVIAFKLMSSYKERIIAPCTYQTYPGSTNLSVFSMLFKEPCIRNAVMAALAKNGVETKIYYDPLVSGLPNTDYVYQRILSLPIHKDVIPVQGEIIEIINTAAKSAKTPGKEYLTK